MRMPQLIYEMKKSSISGKYCQDCGIRSWKDRRQYSNVQVQSLDLVMSGMRKLPRCCSVFINWAELAGDGRLLAVTPWRAPGYEDNY